MTSFVPRPLVAALVLFFTGQFLRATDVLPVTTAECTIPATSSARSAALTTDREGSIFLSWIEPVADGSTELRFAALSNAHTWGSPRVIARGSNWIVNNADRPSLVVGPNGRITALWLVSESEAGSRAFFSQSTDGGATWSPAQSLSKESREMEFPVIQALPDGRVVAVWLDGRGKKEGRGSQQLFARITGAEGPDELVDASVCDCCRPALSAFPDGSSLLAYRGRTKEEVRDIRVALFRDGKWSTGRDVHTDGWQIHGCPVNGPQLFTAGGRAGLAWFTAANGEGRVLASLTPDAGGRWLDPLRVDRGAPAGHVGVVLLADGSLLVTWIESSGEQPGLWLRRITPSFQSGEAVLLIPSEQISAGDYPQVVLVKDYDATPAKLLVAYSAKGDSSPRSLLVTLPDLSTLAGRKPCVPCDEDDARAARGYPVRGQIVRVQQDGASALVRDEEIPGVMRASTLEVRADSGILAHAAAEQDFLGRIERRGKTWWLFNVRWLGSPKPDSR